MLLMADGSVTHDPKKKDREGIFGIGIWNHALGSR